MKLRYHSRWSALAAILTVGVAAGGSGAVYSVFTQVLSTTPPVHEPRGLVRVGVVGGPSTPPEPVPLEALRTLSEDDQFLTTAAGYRTLRRSVRRAEDADGSARDVVAVTPDFFATLGVAMAYGRPLDASDATAVVVGDGLARRWYGTSRAALGQDLLIDGIPHTIVGVTPAEFWFPMRGSDVWVAAPAAASAAHEDAWHVIGRLRQGARVEVYDQLVRSRAIGPDREDERRTYAARTLGDEQPARARMAALALLGPSLVLLVVGVANVSALLLADAVARRRQYGIRVALGATPWHLAAGLLRESVQWAACALLVSVAISWMLMQGIQRFAAVALPALDLVVTFEWTHVGYLLVLVVLAAALTTVLPARYAMHRAIAGRLSANATAMQRRVTGYSTEEVLMVLQVAVVTALLGVSVTLVRAIGDIYPTALPGDSDSLFVVRADGDVKTRAARLQHVARDPAVRVAALSDESPNVRATGRTNRFVDLRRIGDSATAQRMKVRVVHVEPAYFDAMDIDVSRGTGFRDEAGGLLSGVVNEALDRELTRAGLEWSATEFGVGPTAEESSVHIAGVVADDRRASRLAQVAPTLYLRMSPMQQDAASVLLVRTLQGDARTRRALETALHGSGDAAGTVETLSDLSARDGTGAKAVGSVLRVFTVASLVLATLGLGGALRRYVEERRGDIAVRRAVGASARHVVWVVSRRATAVVAVGAVVGAGMAAVGTWATWPELAGTIGTDLVVWVSVIATVTGVAALAACVPTMLALRVDVVKELRRT